MYSICSLMQCILPFNVMKDFSNTYAITRCYYCCFIKLVCIFISDYLRTNKERIFPLLYAFVGITISSTYFCNLS